MLIELRIRDYAVIHDLTLELGPGLSALSGETGAGKSIIVGALSLLLGERASSDTVRTGAERAMVEAVFDVASHPKLGASWEGFALELVLSLIHTRDTYYWATHGGAELDLLIFASGKRFGFEFKYTDAPGLTRSMHVALQDLRLDHLWIVYPGSDRYSLHERIAASPLEAVRDPIKMLDA